MFKSLLLAVDTSHYSEVCTRYALEFARVMNAHVKILTILDKKELAVVYPYYYPSAEFPPIFDEFLLQDQGLELLDQQRKRAEQRVASIEEQCRRLNLSFVSKIESGLVSERILLESQYCDILFLGSRGTGAVNQTDLLGSNLERIIRRCHVPVLVTPHIYRSLRKILLCFDGSDYSVKALHSVADLASSYPSGDVSISLLVVNDTTESAAFIADKAREYLRAYSLRETVHLRSGNPVEQILEAVRKDDVDLVAMGAYGHSPLHKWVLGSTTECVLHKMNRAVLLQH